MTTLAQDISYFNSSATTAPLTVVLSPGVSVNKLIVDLWQTLTSNQPITAGTSNLQADISVSFFDLFYNKIHFLPEKLDLGNVASSQIRSVLLWNAFFTNKSLNAFSAVNASGLDITPPENPVYAIKPLEVLDYIVNVAPSGDATINASMNWTIDTEEYAIPITGNRISAFFYDHNWKYKFVETWNYLTSVIRKKNDTEQRARLRLKPRKSVKFNANVLNNDQAGLNNILHGWHARLFAVPLWSEVSHTTTAILALGSAFSIEEDNLSFHEGMLIALYEDNNNFEMIEIETIVGSSITLTNGTINPWPTGTKVVPLNTARLNNNQAITQYTDQISQVAPYFECDPISTKTNYDGTIEPATYNSRELWIKKINWKQNRKNFSSSLVDTVDSKTGGLRTFPLMEFSAQTKRHTYLLKNRDEIKLFKEFIERRKGKYKSCYVPTFDNDFFPVSGIPAGAAAIDVKDNYYRNYVDEHNARKHIYIELYDGSYFTLEILNNLDLENGTQRLSFSATPGVEILVNDIKLMSILMYARLATDKVEFGFLSAGVAESTLSFTSIKEW
jgi:hypothetical protein